MEDTYIVFRLVIFTVHCVNLAMWADSGREIRRILQSSGRSWFHAGVHAYPPELEHFVLTCSTIDADDHDQTCCLTVTSSAFLRTTFIMTSISLGTVNADRLNVVGGNQVNETTYHIYAAGSTNTSRDPVSNAPFDLLSVHFTGRGKELDFLQTALSKSHVGVPSRCVVHGMPGIGKTQLLLRFAKVSWDHHQYSSIFWISATSVDKINQGISGILDLIEHPDRYIQDQTAKLTAARLWLERSNNDERGGWLLVFDNVHRETLGFLRVHLPLRNERGNILFTTRTEDVAELLVNTAGERHPMLGLQALELRETTSLLFEDAGIDVGSITPSLLSQAEELVKHVGRLPIAVVQAASYMKQTDTSIDYMLKLYEKERKIEVIKWENDLTPYEARSVAGTFAHQFNELDQQSRDVGNLLKFLSFFDPENIPIEMIVDGAEARKQHRPGQNPSPVYPEFDSLIALILSPIEFQMAIKKLQSLSLVERRSHSGTPSLWIHDLIRFMVRERAKKEETYQEWLQSSWSLVYGVFRLIDPTSPQSWADCEKFMPHLQSLKDALNDERGINLETPLANTRMGRYLDSRGRYDAAETMYKEALVGCENLFGIDHLRTFVVMNYLGQVYSSQGRYDEAMSMLNRAREGMGNHLGVDHPNTLASVNGLATVYSQQGRFEEAEPLYRRALDGHEKFLGADHPSTLTLVNNLGRVFSLLGRYDESKILHIRALEGREKHLGTDHPQTLVSVNNLAGVYFRQGRYNEAEPLYRRALDGHEKFLGADHPSTLTLVNNLGRVFSLLGRYDESKILHIRALEGREKHLGTDHPNTLESVNNLGDVYLSQGQYNEAEVFYRLALEGRKKVLGTNHPSTLVPVNNLAQVYSSQGRYSEAEALHKRALDGFEKHLGTDHPNTLTSMNNLAQVYSSQLRYNEAEVLYKRALDGREKILGTNHPDTRISVKSLAGLYLKQGRSDEAEALRRKASQGCPPSE